MNGFKLALAVVDGANGAISLSGKPTGPIITGNEETDDLRYEADLSYAGAFDGGSYKLWASAAFQDHEDLAEDARYWTVGGTLAVAGFEFMAQYSDAEDGTDTTSAAAIAGATAADKQEWDQFIVQAGYRFNGTTLVSANYAELEDKNAAADDTIEKYTVGVYHDVNSNLKLVAEYTSVEDDDDTGLDQDIIAIGGFVFF
jgi:predicted porin